MSLSDTTLRALMLVHSVDNLRKARKGIALCCKGSMMRARAAGRCRDARTNQPGQAARARHDDDGLRKCGTDMAAVMEV